MTDYRIVLVTTPSDEVSQRIAKKLVEDQLAACVNLLPQIRSIYSWEGKLCDDAEQLLIIKTHAARLEALTAAVEALHPYDVPEIIALPIEAGNTPYLDWIAETTGVKK